MDSPGLRLLVGRTLWALKRLGKVANCQGGMFLAYVSPLGRALVDKRLYLPKSWTSVPGPVCCGLLRVCRRTGGTPVKDGVGPGDP